MAVDTDVLRGMIGAAISAVGLIYPIKVPGRNFEIPNDNKYWEILIFKDNNSNEFWGKEKTYSGIVRVILHWPNENAGIYGPNDTLAAIADIFPKGRIIWQNGAKMMISDNPQQSGHIESGSEILYPLTIAYTFFHVPA